MRLHYFDNFRAIAILIIVAGHCKYGWTRDLPWERAISSMITGGTPLFVFISGYFFQAIFAKNFNYPQFMRKKLLAVGLPYLVLSLLFIALFGAFSGTSTFPLDLSAGNIAHHFYAVGFNLLTGHLLMSYWYIPFVILLFAISPVILSFIALKQRQKWVLLGLSCLISLLVHRPSMNINAFHSLIYFLPFYLMGILYGEHRDTANAWLREQVMLVGLVWLILVAVMLAAGQMGNAYAPTPWQAQGMDWMLLQKAAMIAFILAVLLRYADYQIPALTRIADMSFALFFIHPWVIYGFQQTGWAYDLGGFAEFALFASVVVMLSIAIATTARIVAGKWSRYAVGY